MKVVIYTDGGADPNPGIGGWAALLRYGEHEKVLTGNNPQTTNNRMELQAAISALEALNRPCEVEIYVDSEYVRRGITEWIDRWVAKDWKRKGGKDIPNRRLWQALHREVQRHDIQWHWVRGHSGDPLNERVDDLARQARLAITPDKVVDRDAPRLYVRSSCKGNPGPGGWGAVLERDGETEQRSGSEPQTTNNRMELVAILEGLQMVPETVPVQVITTSDYVFQGATKWIHGWRKRGWKKRGGKPISNQDLWQQLDRELRQRQIRWLSAKGRGSDIPQGLEEAGRLAVDAVEIM